MKLTALLISLCLLPGSIFGQDAVIVVVQEDSDAILPCSPSTKGNLVGTVFDWIKDDPRRDDPRRDVFLYDSGTIKIGAEEFRGRVSHFMDELKNGNASIMIRKTKMEDSGNYTCVFPYPQPEKRFHIELVVGASPKPSITTLSVTKDGVQLQCEVQGASPKPEVEFQDSAGNILPADEPQVSEGGRGYTVTRITTVTKTDTIRCVAKQKEIHHETYAEVYVNVYEKQIEDTHSKVDVTGWLIDVERNYKPVPNGDGQVAESSAPSIVPQHNKLCNGFHLTKSSSDNHLTDPPESDESPV